MRKYGKSLFRLAACIGICLAAGGIGSIFTMRSIPNWYAGLAKPSFTPPNWLFAPVWTTLYVMMGIAAFLVLRKKRLQRGVSTALRIFAGQLTLNTLWSIVFFAFHSLGDGLTVIISLWSAIIWTMTAFYRISKPAAWLLLPYLGWVTYATALNYAIWRLNP